MKFMPAILFVCLCALQATAQQVVSGKISNEAGQPIAGCSVFIANTVRGTSSAADGSFRLSDFPPGKHDLVISAVGYETRVYHISEELLPMTLNVVMKIKVKELENVTVEPSEEGSWAEWGKFFIDNFIGTTANASQCHINNTVDIRFRFYKKSRRLVAYADKPIVIENNVLGYIIHYQLEDFEADFENGSVVFLGYSLYEEMTGKEKLIKRWEKSRQKAYEGSVMHFMRAIYQNRLQEEGFETRYLYQRENTEKRRVMGIYQSYNRREINGQLVVEFNPAANKNLPKDSVNYYQSVLRQPNMLNTTGTSLLAADSLLVKREIGQITILLRNDIQVIYRRQKEEPGFVRFNPNLSTGSYQLSSVTALGDKLFTIDPSGNYADPRAFFTGGYWGWSEKMANGLPLEYKPGRE